MSVRSAGALLQIKRHYGSAVLAAIEGAVNAEEYLKLEAMNEH